MITVLCYFVDSCDTAKDKYSCLQNPWVNSCWALTMKKVLKRKKSSVKRVIRKSQKKKKKRKENLIGFALYYLALMGSHHPGYRHLALWLHPYSLQWEHLLWGDSTGLHRYAAPDTNGLPGLGREMTTLITGLQGDRLSWALAGMTSADSAWGQRWPLASGLLGPLSLVFLALDHWGAGRMGVPEDQLLLPWRACLHALHVQDPF